jgi:hypothetical protein
MDAHFLTQLREAVKTTLTDPAPLAACPDASHYFTEKREYDGDLDLPAVVIYSEGFDRETRGPGGNVANHCRLVVRCIASAAGSGQALAAEIARQVEERWFATPQSRTLVGLMTKPLQRVLIDGASEDVVHEDRAYAEVEIRFVATVHSQDGRPALT